MAQSSLLYNMPRMRIAISGYFLLHPATGSGQYTASLVRTLGQVCRDELLLVCPRGALRLASSLVGGFEGPCRVVPVSLPAGGDLGKLWFEQVAVPWACRSWKAGLLHVPYFGPPLVKPCATVVTVHDLIMLLYPETRRSLQARAYTRLAAAACRRADFIVADSMSTREDVLRILGIAPEKVRSIYLACGGGYQPVTDAGILEAVRAKYGLEDEFLFYIGGLDWRKNLPRLLRAFSAISPKPQIAIAGRAFSRNRASFPDLAGLVRELGIRDRVVFMGQVPEEDKVPLYSACLAFVFPSLYEGFGLTPLEAMACGAPTVCSRAGSLPEVVGEAALLFDPVDERDVARALAAVLTDGGLRARMRQSGLEQSRKFSWQRTAEETLEVYRRVHPTLLPRQGQGSGVKGQVDAAGLVGLPTEVSGTGAPPQAGVGRGVVARGVGEAGEEARRYDTISAGSANSRPQEDSVVAPHWRQGPHSRGANEGGGRSGKACLATTGEGFTCGGDGAFPQRSGARIWGNEGLSRWNSALRRARAEVCGQPGRVLEVGCGAGRFTRAMKETNSRAGFYGCDLDVRALSVGRRYGAGVRYAGADLHALPFRDGQFQAVLLFDVLEHLQEPGQALREVYRVLAPGGLLHALVPCEGQPGSLHWLLRMLHLGGDLKERHSGHIQRFTRREVLLRFSDNGFRVERVSYSLHPIGQVRDILSYVGQEDWFRRRRLDNFLYLGLMRLLWAASYVESNLLLKEVPLGAVALHVTARKGAPG
ncbi:MAG TPA: glycosyltransferase [Dehalococcoidia bacterium]|nr:glycosyltransferase [Dehalococcoidia bacterium]